MYCNEGIHVPGNRRTVKYFEDLTKLLQVSGTDASQNFQTLRVFSKMRAELLKRSEERVVYMLYPYPGYYCGHGRTEHPVTPGTGMNFVHTNSKSSRYGYECPTELTSFFCLVKLAVNTPGTVCTYPTDNL